MHELIVKIRFQGSGDPAKQNALASQLLQEGVTAEFFWNTSAVEHLEAQFFRLSIGKLHGIGHSTQIGAHGFGTGEARSIIWKLHTQPVYDLCGQ